LRSETKSGDFAQRGKWGDKGIKSIEELAVISKIELKGRGTFEAFEKTFEATTMSQKVKAYELWGNEEWDNLYDLFNPKSGILINSGYPPFNGFYSITDKKSGNEIIKDIFDRFQDPGNKTLGGRFASPVEKSEFGVLEKHYSYDSRALSNEIQEGTVYIKFKIKNKNGITLNYGEAIPWKTKTGIPVSGKAMQIESNVYFKNFKSIDYEIIQLSIRKGGKWEDEIKDLSRIFDKINCN
jgi:hypothetical protein